MACYEGWPILEFSNLKPSILARFSTEAGEIVCETLIKELVEHVDKLSVNSLNILIENDQELEWTMQIVNHAFDLPFHIDSTYRTLSSSVRIYLAWMTALTLKPHKCCPLPLISHPDKYFKKMIEAFRNIFVPKTLPITSDMETALCRQGNEIRTILTAIRHLTSSIVDDYKDEVWSRLLLFLMAVTDQLLSETKNKDELGCLISNDLSQALFDCWIKAALLEFIPSLSYWHTLSFLIYKWISHVPVIEWWSRKLTKLTILVLKSLNGNYLETEIYDKNITDAINLNKNEEILKTVWLNTFRLLGNPMDFLKHSKNLLEYLPLDASNASYFSSRVSLSFFVAISAFCKVVDIFLGDFNVSTDFHESEELQAQWLEALLLIEEKTQSCISHRSSNLSNSEQPNQGLNKQFANNQGNNEEILHNFNRKNLNSTLLQDLTQRNQILNNLNITNISQQPSSGQLVWFILRSNPLKILRVENKRIPYSTVLLNVFLEWLFETAINSRNYNNKLNKDVTHEKKLISNENFEKQQLQNLTNINQQFINTTILQSLSSASNFQNQMHQKLSITEETSISEDTDEVNRRSFAQSNASSSDVSLLYPQSLGTNYSSFTTTYGGFNSTDKLTNVFDYPSIDGILAGRASAIGALCKIVCAKSSEEDLDDKQLAHFYLVLQEALIERERLVLCSLLYFTVDIFKLGLPGVEILLPNFIGAIDIILTESMKLRLHPSISEVEMRNACIRNLASIISWPTTFGTGKFFSDEFLLNSNLVRRSKLIKSSSINVYNVNSTYLDLRQQILRILVYVLRHETDTINLQLTLALCFVFCIENVRYDILKLMNKETEKNFFDCKNLSINENKNDVTEDDAKKCFAVSALRGVVSAICDNLCKPQWTNDLAMCMSALDCLNSLSTLPYSILFYQNELSTGALIVTSLCRFIDTQLQKPPMFHSRDLHSSIVIAYFTLTNWISAAPILTEIESCLSTLAQTIKFGMTGGKSSEPLTYKPASQRVYDAAEYFLHFLFSLPNFTIKNFFEEDNEIRLINIFGSKNVNEKNFKYFLLKENSIISLHEAQHIFSISNGFPTVLAVIRSPFRNCHTCYFQLKPKVTLDDYKKNNSNNTSTNDFSLNNDKKSLITPSVLNNENSISFDQEKNVLKKLDMENLDLTEPIQQFKFPPEIQKIECKLDAEHPILQSTPQIQEIQENLKNIHNQLKNNSLGTEYRDKSNVWIQSSFESVLTEQPKPENAVEKCDSIRVFLYDLGLITKETVGKKLIPLDFAKDSVLFKTKLTKIVDSMPVNFIEKVSIFYVRKNQCDAVQILQNCENLQKTNKDFCKFLSYIGKGVDISKNFDNYRANWKTAFINESDKTKNESNEIDKNYLIDGHKSFLYWRNAQIEIAFLTPTLQNYLTLEKFSSKKLSFNITKDCDSFSQNLSSPTNSRKSDVSSLTKNSNSSNYSDSGLPPIGGPKSKAWVNWSAHGCNNVEQNGVISNNDKTLKKLTDFKILIVWLEKIEDMYQFPFDQLLSFNEKNINEKVLSNQSKTLNELSTRVDFMIIYLYSVEPGLIQINTEGTWTKRYGQPAPLMDGMIVSLEVLGSLIQQTVCSVARRKITEVENYQLTHVKRRQSILEFCRNFKMEITYADFLDFLTEKT